MIRRIELLRDFGIFKNFEGNEESGVPEFNRFHLIYGWNYSGKTTVSRVFQAIERKGLSREYIGARFKVIQHDGSEVNSENLTQAPVVRVFNRDYVTQNFQQEYSAPAVFIVGEVSANLKRRVVQLRHRLDQVNSIESRLNVNRDTSISAVETLGTNCARDIGNLLGDRNFRRPNLDQRMREVRNSTATYTLGEATVDARLATLRSGESFAVQPRIAGTPPDLFVLVQEVNALLSLTASNQAIERLKSNVGLEGWVRLGLSLHKGADSCEFCGSLLSAKRLELLQGHFSEAYETLLNDLDRKIQLANSQSFNVSMPHEREIMPDERPEFLQLQQALSLWTEWAEGICKLLVDALNQKKSAIETQNTWDGDVSRAAEAQTIIQDLNAVIERHNTLVSDINQAKASAKLSLEHHYASQHFQDNQIEQKEQGQAYLQGRLQVANVLRTKISAAIRSIEIQISQAAVGPAKLNELLKYLLAGSNIEVQGIGESEFRFIRGGNLASNLSDGEKTAVTFAYFLTSLEANGASPADAIVFVDDPISSLDSNHIYAVYALISERLEKCHQLFVSTHNSEFFSLLKDQWLGPKGGNKPDCSAYLISRHVQTDGSSQSAIGDLPKLLRKYKSEYEYVFYHLYTFAVNPSPSEHEAYTAPNLLRKFLEAYLGFRKPSITKWHEKLDILFDTSEERLEVSKFADDASHLQSLSRSLQQPAFVTSSQRLVCNVIKALKIKDPDHHASLLDVVGPSPRNSDLS